MILQITALPAGAAAPLAVMHRACFPDDPWDAAALARILALAGCFGYLAWAGDEPTGFLIARDLGEEAELLSVGVLPGCRRHGVGRALLDALLDEAMRRCFGSLVLEVAIGNEAARRLYEASGFVVVGRRPRYYRLREGIADALIMRRAIGCQALPE